MPSLSTPRSNSTRSTERFSGRKSANTLYRARSSKNDSHAFRVTSSLDIPLDRRLGPLDAAAIVVSNVIGGGIFFVPILVARAVPDSRTMLLVWLVGGAFSFAGAMAYAELGALRPRSGGEYVYLREAFGPLAAFLTGWTSFVAGFSGAIAASAVALAEHVGRFAPGAADT